MPSSLARCADYFRARAIAAEVIVADDGSTDGTPKAYAAAAESLAAPHLAFRYLPLPHRGKGAAVRAGVAAARGDPIVFLDADLTIPVDIVDGFLRALADGADIAIASRYIKGSIVERPWWRKAMGDVFRLFVRLLVPTGIQDTQCGGKAYTAEAAAALFAIQRLDGFAFDAEVLFLARRAGYRVIEIPFALRQAHESSIAFLSETPKMFRDLVQIRLNAGRGRYRASRQA